MGIPIETERLLIREWEEGDWQDNLEYASDPVVARYEYWEPYDEKRVRQFIASQRELKPGQEGKWVEFAVVLKSEGKAIGDAGIKVASKAEGQGEIGFTLNSKYQGRGLAFEAAEAVLEFAFRELGLHRVFSTSDVRNTPSLKLMERLGMRREATFRQNRFIKGEWRDEYVYAILVDEWKENRDQTPGC